MPENFVLTEYDIVTKYAAPGSLPGPVTIALIADLHERDPEVVLEHLHRLRPDLILVAGDTFERKDHG